MEAFMKRDRSQAVVCRDGKLLLVEHFLNDRDFYNLPGGGIEDGETPAEAALRELEEEAGVKGKIVRPLTIEYKPDMQSRIFSFLIEIDEDAVPVKGIDPELPMEEQTIKGVKWLALNEIAERDRAYLFGAGLMRIPQFHDEVLSWRDDEISYPEKSKDSLE
jgi:8-oxo-dGTP pyrophosphatase MutT (NUDIX family)